MHRSPARHGALFPTLATALILGALPGPLSPTHASAQTVDGTSPPAVVTDNANPAVPVASVAPAGPGQPAVGDMLHTDAKGRHLAPHGVLYLLEYVSVKTDKGVEGFEPGQEVRVVEVHRPTQTLVVSDGRAQVEVSPTKLTHDMDIAAMVRRKDQANQAQIAAYIQAEQAAYVKAEKEAAAATAKDVERHNKEQEAASRIVDNTIQATSRPAQTADASAGGSGYYGYGGYGYGSPYSYFDGDGGTAVVANPANTGTASANSPTTGAGPTTGTAVGSGTAGKIAAPSRSGGAGGKR